MSTYKVRATRTDTPGTYNLVYGKGSKKVTGTITRTGDNKWINPIMSAMFGEYDTKRELIEAWRSWAEGVYRSRSHPSATRPPSIGPPKLSKPPYTPPALPPAIPRPKPLADTGPLEDQLNANPFDPQLQYPPDHPDVDKRRKLTPLGLVVEIQAWCGRHTKQIEAINKGISSAREPGFNPFTNLAESVKQCITRELKQETTVDDE